MNIRPSIFLTADTHFGHEKQVNLWGKRPPQFEELIIEKWNSVVHKHDIVLHLGDLTMTNKEQTIKWTHQLNGEKYLIRGNHDEASDSWYRDCGFEVIPGAFQIFKDKYDHYFNVFFTHVPVAPLPAGDWFNIHGHLHGDHHRRMEGINDHYYDVGVDPRAYLPVRLSDVLNEFKLLLSSNVQRESIVVKPRHTESSRS